MVKPHAMKNPPHPGDFIRNRDYPARGPLGNGSGSRAPGVPACPVQPVNSKANLSGDMALRIEKAFGVKMDTLMRMQASYDIAQTHKREKKIHVRRIRSLANVHA
jgi:antitoxin HigA-1